MKLSKKVADIFENLDGVEVTHHYLGDSKSDVYVHIRVANDEALRGLLDFAAAANVGVQIYRHGNEYRYTAVIPPTSFENVILVDEHRRKACNAQLGETH